LTAGKDFKDELEEKKRTASYLSEKYYKKLSDFGVCVHFILKRLSYTYRLFTCNSIGISF